MTASRVPHALGARLLVLLAFAHKQLVNLGLLQRRLATALAHKHELRIVAALVERLFGRERIVNHAVGALQQPHRFDLQALPPR